MQRFIFNKFLEKQNSVTPCYINRHNASIRTSVRCKNTDSPYWNPLKTKINFDYKWFEQFGLIRQKRCRNISNLNSINGQKRQKVLQENEINIQHENMFINWKKKISLNSECQRNQRKTTDSKRQKLKLNFINSVNTPSVGDYQICLDAITPRITRDIKINVSNSKKSGVKQIKVPKQLLQKSTGRIQKSKLNNLRNRTQKIIENNNLNQIPNIKDQQNIYNPFIPLNDAQISKIWIEKLDKYKIPIKNLPIIVNIV